MTRAFVGMLALMIANTTLAEVPEVDDFRRVPQYPDPVEGASATLGADQSDGRLILWDGDTIYRQEEDAGAPGALFEAIATGYLGEPSFVDLSSDDDEAVLGSGVDGIVYWIDISSPDDYEVGAEILVPTHASGVLLSDNLLLLDRAKDDLSGAELVVVDLDATGDTRGVGAAIISKPLASGTAALYVDSKRSTLYAMDSTTRELRSFSVSAIRDAFEELITLDWEIDGTPIGVAGDFLNGGVGGINEDGELIIGGSTGEAMSGGIQYVMPGDPPEILAVLDPAATAPPYIVMFNTDLDQLIAIDATTDPPDVYATELAVPPILPETPCDDFVEIDAALTVFIDTYANGASDINGDGIPESAIFEMVELISCQSATKTLVLASNMAYDTNLLAIADEASYEELEEVASVIAILMQTGVAMQDMVRALLQDAGITLTETYEVLTCTDEDTCFPEFVEDPDPQLRGTETSVEEYTTEGDPDFDGFTNLEEYNNVVAMGGTDLDFAIAAVSDELDGTDGLSAGEGGSCFIATAAYGTPLAGEIDTLRSLRDRHLLTTVTGAAFVDIYYRLSPSIADRIADDRTLMSMTRAAIAPLPVLVVTFERHADALLVLMIFSCAAVSLRARRRSRDRHG